MIVSEVTFNYFYEEKLLITHTCLVRSFSRHFEMLLMGKTADTSDCHNDGVTEGEGRGGAISPFSLRPLYPELLFSNMNIDKTRK